jgi:nucleoid-associated protein YgaU
MHTTENGLIVEGQRSHVVRRDDDGKAMASLALSQRSAKTLTPAAILHLQRSAGNASVARWLGTDQEGKPLPIKEVVGPGGECQLDGRTKYFMESRWGHDFSDVRVHADSKAAEPPKSVQAHAPIAGTDLVFEGGQHCPETNAGKNMLADKLTHAAQQKAGPPAGTPAPRGIQTCGSSDSFERQAKHPAEDVLSQPAETAITPATARLASLQCQGDEELEVAQRAIKDTNLPVPYGHFEIDMAKVEDFSAGETGKITFIPNTKGPDSKSIRLSQAARIFDVNAKAEHDWTEVGRPERGNLNKMQTTDSDKTHVTTKGETLRSIALQHYGDPSRFAEVFEANKATLTRTMTTAEPDKSLPKRLSLLIPKAVAGGFFIDHSPQDTRAKVRTSKKDPIVPQDYVWSETKGVRQHGSKAGKKTEPAIMEDTPKTPSSHLRYTFETVARSDNPDIKYGTLHWSFDADATGAVGKVDNETHHVVPGVSDTYRAALVEFNKFYKNPPTQRMRRS